MKLNKLIFISLVVCNVAHTALNDTGITTCSNATQNGLPCPASGNTPPSKEKAATALANIAVPFEENRGQADAKVAFQARTLAGPLFVTKTGELVWSLTSPSPIKPEHSKLPPKQHSQAEFVGPPQPTYSVVERFVGGAAPKPAGAVPSATQVSYFHGNDRSKWQNSVPTWNQVSLGEVWPGINVSLAARGKNAEKLFTVAAGTDASKIALEIVGGKVAIASDGGLQVENNGRPLVTFTAPIAFQLINGERKSVPVSYRLAANNQYGFTLGAHDATQPVIIDPLLQATYLGGSGDESINAIAVTADAVYVAGYTYSANFPGVSGGAQASNAGSPDAFVAKLSLDLKTLTQASFLGGSSNDYAQALSVSSSAVYVAGFTYSANFPGVSGGALASCGGCPNYHTAFIAKLSLDLKSLTQASFLGGSNYDAAQALTVSSSAVYVAGYTYSANFPGVSGGAQSSFGGGGYDSFVAKLSLDLKALTQASFLGGNNYDVANALTVSSSAVYVAGYTYSANFPGVSGGAQSSFGGGSYDGFVAKLSLDLTALTQASFLGGSSYDEARALTVSSSAVYVAGYTYSANFPGVSGGAQSSFGGSSIDSFVAKLSLDLKSLTQASFLGGSDVDYAYALSVSSSAVYVAGSTVSANFPGVSGGAQASNAGSYDGFVAKLSLDLKSLTQASFLGGSSYDWANALSVSSSAVYVAGYTDSANFPGVNGGAQSSFGGSNDGFVARLTPDLRLVGLPLASSNAPSLITATSAKLSGTVHPSGASTSVSFDFGPSAAYGTNLPATPATIAATAGATAVTAIKADLLCLTPYHYRVKAVNSAGTAYGLDQSFTTNSTCPAEFTQLTNGVAATNQTITAGEWKYFYLSVPAGADNLKFVSTGTGDIDLYAQANALPSMEVFACHFETGSSNETCQPATTTAGTWWLGVVAYEDSTFNLTGSFKQAQTIGAITLNPAAPLVAGRTATVSATASSGLPVTFTSATIDICSVSGTTVNALSVGTCSIKANQAGDASYAAAPEKTQNFNVVQLAQTISAITLTPATFTVGGTATASATASSGLPVTFTTATPTVCSATGSNGSVIQALHAGTCTVTANQSGDASYLAAPAVSKNSTVGKAAQTINLTCNPTSITVGTTADCTATASSGLTPVLSSATPVSICTLSGGSTGSPTTLTGVAVGTCTVAATQAGDSDYLAATATPVSIPVAKGNQTVTLTCSPLNIAVGNTASCSATATSGLTVSLTVIDTSICSIATGTVTGVAVGICGVKARQIGNANYNVATPVTQNITVGTPTFTVTPSAGTGGAVNPSSAQSINPGSTASFTVTANSGYTIDNAVTGTCPQGSWNGNVWTTGTITGNCSVTFSFTRNTYTVTPTAGTGGTVSPNTAQTINHGATTTFTVTTNAGYTKNTTVTGTCPQGIWNGNAWTTGTVIANCTVTFGFTPTAVNSWLESPTKIVLPDREFTLAVTAKSDTMQISKYEYTIKFDANKLTLDWTKCNNGVCAGLNALSINTVFLIDGGTVNVTGLGGTTGPGNDLQLLIINLKSKTILGTTAVDLTTNSLLNTSGNSIGLNARGTTVNVVSGICGDATGDVVVNIIDALAVARKVVGLPPPPTIEPAWADVDKNGTVSIVDAMHIARYSIGLVTPPEVCRIGVAL